MPEKNGNGKWWVTPALSVAMLLVGWGVGWGSNSSAMTRAMEDIKNLQAAQRSDHDCVVEVRTKLVSIETSLAEIKTMLQKKQ